MSTPEANVVQEAPATTETVAPEGSTPATTEEAQAEAAPNGNTNINNLSLGSQVDDIDPEADIDTLILPRDGIHTLRLKAGKSGVYGPATDKDGNPLSNPKIGKNGRGFFVADVEVYLVHENPRYDGLRIWKFQKADSPGVYLTSQVSQRIPTSQAADVANKSGYPFKKGATLDDNRAHIEQLLAAEISVKGMIQWQATKETGETDDNGYPVRVVAVRGEKNFPPLVVNGEVQMEDGQPMHNPRMTLPTGEEVVAQAIVTRFLPITLE